MHKQTELHADGRLKAFTLDNNRAMKLFLILISIVGLLSFSKYGLDPTPKVEAPSQTIVTYTSNPGKSFRKINIRSGPGTGYSVIKEVNRGELVFGIGYKLDAHGDRWIQLQNGGYAKETVLKKK